MTDQALIKTKIETRFEYKGRRNHDDFRIRVPHNGLYHLVQADANDNRSVFRCQGVQEGSTFVFIVER